jgi:hypothetical protein
MKDQTKMRVKSITRRFVFFCNRVAMHSCARILFYICLLAAIPVLAGRGVVPPMTNYYTMFESDQNDDAEVHVSMIGIRTLNTVIDDLQPVFDLTPAQALQTAIPDTLNSSQSALSSLNTELQLGLMFNSASPTNVAPANPSVPNQPVSPLSILTNLPTGALSVDPLSQYQAAASLFEQIKLLNRSLKDIPHFDSNYVAYIVTVQVALIPHKRFAPFDAYADITFFSDTNVPPAVPEANTEKVPYIFPLLTTDDLEGADDQQTANQIRQIGLALAAAFHGVGIQGGFNQLNQELNTINGNNLNSLLTVGKINQNTMVVRLGAQNQAGTPGQLNLVPETHNIAFLVFVDEKSGELQMVSRTVLRKTGTGEEIPKHNVPEELAGRSFGNLMCEYDFFDQDTLNRLMEGQNFRKHLKDLGEQLIDNVYDNPSGGVETLTNDIHSFFTNESFFTDSSGFNKTEYAKILLTATNALAGLDIQDDNSFWLDITRLGSDQYSGDLIPLPPWRPMLPDTNYAVFYKDDGQSTVFTISGGHRLPSNKVKADLTFSNGFKLHAESIDIADFGTVVSANFSPALSAIAGDTNDFTPTQLALYWYDGYDYGESNVYRRLVTLKPSSQQPEAPGWTILRTYGTLVAGPTNSFDIVFGTNSTAGQTNWFLDIEGSIVLANYPSNQVLGARANGVYQLNVNSNREVTFTLGQLSAGQVVDFDLLDSSQKFVTNMDRQFVYPSSSSQAGAASSKTGPGGQ